MKRKIDIKQGKVTLTKEEDPIDLEDYKKKLTADISSKQHEVNNIQNSVSVMQDSLTIKQEELNDLNAELIQLG